MFTVLYEYTHRILVQLKHLPRASSVRGGEHNLSATVCGGCQRPKHHGGKLPVGGIFSFFCLLGSNNHSHVTKAFVSA